MLYPIQMFSTFAKAISSANNLSQKALNYCRQYLDNLEIKDAKLAHFLCQLIPTQCPFARDIHFCGFTLHIPPLCKLNPLYEEVVSLRFRALCYLADICQEDIQRYC